MTELQSNQSGTSDVKILPCGLDDFDKWIIILKWFDKFSDIQKQNLIRHLTERRKSNE